MGNSEWQSLLFRYRKSVFKTEYVSSYREDRKTFAVLISLATHITEHALRKEQILNKVLIALLCCKASLEFAVRLV